MGPRGLFALLLLVADYTADAIVFNYGVKYGGSTVNVFSKHNLGLSSCGAKCYSETKCQGFNYYHGDEQCELVEGIEAGHEGDYVDDYRYVAGYVRKEPELDIAFGYREGIGAAKIEEFPGVTVANPSECAFICFTMKADGVDCGHAVFQDQGKHCSLWKSGGEKKEEAGYTSVTLGKTAHHFPTFADDKGTVFGALLENILFTQGDAVADPIGGVENAFRCAAICGRVGGCKIFSHEGGLKKCKLFSNFGKKLTKTATSPGGPFISGYNRPLCGTTLEDCRKSSSGST